MSPAHGRTPPGARDVLLLCADLFRIIEADACDFDPSGETVDIGLYRRIHYKRIDRRVEVYRGADHSFCGNDGSCLCTRSGT